MASVTRRQFLARSVAAGTLSMGIGTRARAIDAPLAFQIHAVRTAAARDFAGTLRTIAAFGYGEVELVSFRGYDSAAPRDGFRPLAPLQPNVVRATIRDAGLSVGGAHFKYEEFQASRIDDSIAWARGVGLDCMTVSDIPPATGLDEWKLRFEALRRAGRRVRSEGMRLGLHTQNDLWRNMDGTTVMDALLQNVDADHCSVQLDLSTTQSMGVNPMEFLREHGRRCYSVHLRDAKTPAQPGGYLFSLPLGEGDVDLRGVLAAAQSAGIDELIVEMQVQAPADPVDALRRSAQYLRSVRL